MKIHLKNYRVPGRRVLDLTKWPTNIDPLYTSKKQYKKHLARDAKELGDLQRVLSANGSYAVLLIFQAMDAAGKDGAISHVLSGVHPQGCVVHVFKNPSAEELTHDFLWRTTRQLPARGMIGVFNRSYYEEVLVVREHHKLLVSEDIPHEKGGDEAIWKGRQRSLVEFEQRAAKALPGAHRRARQELEVQRGGCNGTSILGSVREALRGLSERHQHEGRALAHRAGG